MFSAELISEAGRLIAELRARSLRLATAESCTGGLIAALFTEIPGASDIFECGFVTYSNAAKVRQLGVDRALLDQHGAVSAEVAEAMAAGARQASSADVAISVTGIAGPGGGSAEKPVGLVYIGLSLGKMPVIVREFRFGDLGRSSIRVHSVKESLRLLGSALAG
jgi:nicotinamide-nucleotide amidase